MVRPRGREAGHAEKNELYSIKNAVARRFRQRGVSAVLEAAECFGIGP